MGSPLIYLSRHGESQYNVEDRLGGDPELTAKGVEDARNLGRFLCNKHIQVMYFSPLKRAAKTAEIMGEYLPHVEFIQVEELREIYFGLAEYLTTSELRARFPEEHRKRGKNKYRWKLPAGESYEELDRRVQPFLNELRGREGICGIITHRSVAKIVFRAFSKKPLDEILNLEIPHDVIFEIHPSTGEIIRHKIALETLDSESNSDEF